MSFLIPIPHSLISVFFFVIFSLFSLSLSNPRITQDSISCGTTRPPHGTDFIPNYIQEVNILTDLVHSQQWGAHSYGSNATVYSLAQCMEDLSPADCAICFTESRLKIRDCFPAYAARVYLDGCFLRYDNYSFFHESIDYRHDKVVCNSPAAVMASEAYMGMEYAMKVREVIRDVKKKAVANEGFGATSWKGGVVNLYALAQCWKTVNMTECEKCLEKAWKDVKTCLPAREGRALNAGCYLRVSTTQFYNDGADKISHDSNDVLPKTLVIILIPAAAIAFSLLSLFGACVGYKRLSKITKARNHLGRVSSAISNSNLNFKYETLEKATNSFDPSNKLGQGGAGSVFKGTLPDGRTVAVKRLFFNTRQWVDEFFNEINLISGIQHKNLIKLLGCSIEGPESLLVYEYVPNKSLDQILFDRKKVQILSWQQRFDIIVGTAEGLAYLHGGSQTRIIHRDIKCSNILLDENLNPKIADFGLVRCFAPDKSHVSTGIAGTLGYMAPEYLVRGQLTEKADVYSFGVLVLEIVSGRKNNVFMQDSGSILQAVWEHYKSNSLQESVDSCLKGDFPVIEASNVLLVGLLCTQASVSLRPSMSQLIQMLTDKDCDIPSPMQPPFLNASVMDPDTSTVSFGMDSSASNEPTDTANSSIMYTAESSELTDTYT